MAFAPPLAPVSNATVSVTPAVVPPNVTFAALSPPDPEDLKDKIRHQIEYYFSEENLVKDVFIRKKMDCDGYLPISLIASFHRVASLTQDVNMIISALKDSLSVELSESQLKARPRNHPKSWPMSDKPIGSNSNAAPLDSSSSSSTNPASPSSSLAAAAAPPSAPSNSSLSPSSLSNVNGTSNQTVNSATDASSREFVTSTYQLTTDTSTAPTPVAAAAAVAVESDAASPALDSVSTAAPATVVSMSEIINDTVETVTAAAASVTAASTSVNVVATSSGSTTNDSLNATSPANKSPRQQDTTVVGGNSELHADVPSFVPGKPYNVTTTTTTSDSSP